MTYTTLPESYTGTATKRRDIRQTVRNYLGTSRSSAPSIFTVLYCARQMGRLLDLTSGGRYGLAIVESQQVVGPLAVVVYRPIDDVQRELLAIRDGKAA